MSPARLTEVPIARLTRERTAFDEPLLPPGEDEAALVATRRLARRLAAVREPGAPVAPRPHELQAMALIHEAMHRIVERHARTGGEDTFDSALKAVAREVGPEALEEALHAYAVEFPVAAVYSGAEAPGAYLDGETSDRPHREHVLEELLLLWLANRNPAFVRHGELFDEAPVAGASLYGEIVENLRRHLATEGDGPGDDLISLLLAPTRVSPHSLVGQLRYIRDNWPGVAGLIDQFAPDLDRLGALERGEVAPGDGEDGDEVATPAAGTGGAGPADAQALQRFAGLEEELEAFSPDRDWMPRLVLIAKSTHVWLDQLSRAHGRAIRTLESIPDEELDLLAARGFTGLWLIGVWQRSHASQMIKQRRGNPEAVASAYSLMDYRISEDLGGEDGFARLRERAMERGVRLACDMVPNHMGIDSRWVIEHPEWFISRPDSPFAAYSFTGPNLSPDERVGIYLEDHYDDGSDAAVVFKRVDRWSREERFVYHGNDGTGMPWNDTAQLDYLREDVRDAVMETIIAVARRAPIIRFDAAMTLARRHVQRLWYPRPGQGESIPSRADAAMAAAEFHRRMPREFWREVVDRIAVEVPDTLLLAEAFWLMEGFFVRTLGMHRVYNSAFMHMLRDEDNAGYRTVLRNTLAFDPEILKGYVDFMTNPDERTAVDQFGSGDKAFGVATVMATLPGVPMFGHGQVEAFTERYGMEFRRARLDEQPDEEHAARYEREIVPLLHQRSLFAGGQDFLLYDVADDGGGVVEDVFAYTNRQGDRRALIVYHNSLGDVRGTIRDSVPVSVGAGDGSRALVTRSLVQALDVPADEDTWLLLRDERSGMEWLHHGRALHEQGLALSLGAYDCRVFLDPRLVRDDPGRRLARLAQRLQGRGVQSVETAIADELVAPARAAIAELLDASTVREAAGAAFGDPGSPGEPGDARTDDQGTTPAGLLKLIGELVGNAHEAPHAAELLATRMVRLSESVRHGRRRGSSNKSSAVARWLGIDRSRWTTVVGWMSAEAIAAALGLDLQERSDPAAWMAAWGVDVALASTARSLGAPDDAAERVVDVTSAMLEVPDHPFGAFEARPSKASGSRKVARAAPTVAWLASSAARRAGGWNTFDGRDYVDRDSFADLVDALVVRDLLKPPSGEASGTEADGIADAAERLKAQVEASGWLVEAP